ncbi:hypothetical protein PIROE2DRAFT_9830 [Piromyces sp. E2]|nr:hypothetical protein PIROE2DRAFT_9830 [Piromyces sp. E2]|eukprot:OUM63612.1 hypothetical protein PIROE2DRAFT_9830 [Piromyces sp. E2]
MSLFIYQQPFENLIFDDFFEDDLMDYPLDQLNHYQYHHSRYSNRKDNKRKRRFLKRNQMILDTFNDENDDDNAFTELEPDFELTEDKNNYYIYVELPSGMSKDQIKIEADEEEGIITISGENEIIFDNTRNDDDDDDMDENDCERFNVQDKNDLTMVEHSYNNFSRSFNIPEDANIKKIQGKVKKGILEITIKKAKSSRRKIHKIEVQ